MTTVRPSAATTPAPRSAHPPWMPRRRRSTRLLLLAVVLAVVGMLLGVYVYRAAVDRVAVIATARPITAGSVISKDDLRQAFVPTDSDLATIPWDQVDAVVGGFAATDLLTGQAIPPGATTRDRLPQAGEAVVGLSVQPGRVPSGELSPRDDVLVVTDPGVAPVRARIVRASEQGVNGRRDVDVLVSEADASLLSSASAAEQVSIVLVGRH